MRQLIIILLLISSISCSGKNDTPAKTSDKPKYTLKDYQTIIPAVDNMDYLFGKGYKEYTPAEDDIEAAEKLLIEGMEMQKMGTVNRLLNRKPEDYFRQFVGAINSKGEKIIWVNCFCKTEESSFKDWKKNIVYVKDGGNCFFNLKTNISANTLTDFFVNGNG